MQTIRTIVLACVVSLACVVVPLGGCEKKSEPAKPAAGASGSTKHGDHAHKGDDGHGHDLSGGHGDGPTTQLGEQAAGGFTIKASRDGAITPGKDAAIDVWVTGGSAKVAAVRFWIGSKDAKGSVKAKAEIEKDNWHTHAEIPDPIPAGSQLWVEIETDTGEKVVTGFDLKN